MTAPASGSAPRAPRIALRRTAAALPVAAFEAALQRLDDKPGIAQGCDFEAAGWFRRELWLAVAPAVRGDLAGGRWRFSAASPAGLRLLQAWQRAFGGPAPSAAHPVWPAPAPLPAGDGDATPAARVRQLTLLLETLDGETTDLAWHGVFRPTIWASPTAAQTQTEATVFLPLDLLHLDPSGARRIRFELPQAEGDADPPASGSSGEDGAVGVRPPIDDGDRNGARDDDAEAFRQRLAELIRRLGHGDAWSAVLSRGFRRRSRSSPMQAFARLRARYPMPVMYAVHFGARRWLFGASPNVQARLRDGLLSLMPVCGTVPRGRTPAEDAERLQGLIDSAKEAASLAVGSDDALGRMAALCEPDSLAVVARRRLHAFTTLAHTYDHLQGRLRPGRDAADVLVGVAAPATGVGVPRAAAWSLSEALELSARDWYTGAIGRITRAGDLELGTVLRCAHVRDDVIEVRGGGLILARSEVGAEADETGLKAAALLDLLTGEDGSAAARMAASSPASPSGPAGPSPSAIPSAPALPASTAAMPGSGAMALDPLAAGLQACAVRAGIAPGGPLVVRSEARAPDDGCGEGDGRWLLVGAAAEAALQAAGVAGEAVEPALGDPAVIDPVAGEWLEPLGRLTVGDYRCRRFPATGLPPDLQPLAVDAADGSLRAWRDRRGTRVGLLCRPDSIWAWSDGQGQALLARLADRLRR